MYIIVGLGNYGNAYEHTRHNAGCDSLNVLAQRNQISLTKRKFQALVGEGLIGGQKALLAFPQTYMNASGDSVVQLDSFYHPAPEELVVLYDDADLPAGALRIRASGSAGTHNGMRDITQQLGRQDFVRVRIGIGKPAPMMDIKDYVLGKIPKTDWELMFACYTRAAMAVEEIIKNGISSAQAHFNGPAPVENP